MYVCMYVRVYIVLQYAYMFIVDVFESSKKISSVDKLVNFGYKLVPVPKQDSCN
jgi:hypothetical protein